MTARMGQELPFPQAELDRRLARARAALVERGLVAALLFDSENIYYLTGYQSIGYFTYQALLMPARGAPVLISRSVNRYLAVLRPGITAGEADLACREVIAAAGYGEQFVHRVAYAVGIGFPPNWSEGKTLALRADAVRRVVRPLLQRDRAGDGRGRGGADRFPA